MSLLRRHVPRSRFALRAPARRLALVGAAFALALMSCGREVTAPLSGAVRYARALSFQSVFPGNASLVSGGSGLVAFTKVRVVLHRADGTVALDTVVNFPSGLDSLAVSLSVTLAPGAPATGEQLTMNLGYVNAAGDTVFKGGPVTVLAMPAVAGQGPPPSVQVPLTYTGPGANASRVVISPRTLAVWEGDGFTFSAVAQDAAGATLTGTPVVWTALDPALARLAAPAAGAGTAGTTRGTARIVAQLLTGPVDTVTVRILLRAATIATVSGDAQSGIVGTALAQPLVTRVTARDGVGVAGVSVSFAVVTGAGSVGAATVTTDTAGRASTTWTLGAATGAQSVTASATGLAGSPLTFAATARSVAPVKLVFSSNPPERTAAGAAIGPVTVSALDAQGDVAKTFTGTVTVALAPASPGAPLAGTLTAAAAAGVATFPDLRISVPNTGYLLSASASGLAGATSTAFAIVAGPAARLEFGSYPVNGATAGDAIDAITVIARDAAGNIATGFTGTVTIGLAESPAGATLGGTATATAVAGVSTFETLNLTRAGTYRLSAAATGVTGVNGPQFPISPGIEALIVLISGGGQTGNAGSPLAQPIVVQVADRYGNPVRNTETYVRFSPVDEMGSASPCCIYADAAGQASAVWTLAGSPGTQSLVAWSGGLISSPDVITAYAIAQPVASVSISPASATVLVAQTTQLWATTRDAGANVVTGRVVTWTTSNAAVATVDAWGSVTAVAAGTATITATSEGRSGTATITVSAISVTASVSSGSEHSCALTAAGLAYCWGSGADGKLGNNGGFSNSTSPSAVAGGLRFRSVSAGQSESCGVTIAGDAYCWGDNLYNQLGTNLVGRSTVPLLIPGGLNFVSVSVGSHDACALTSAGVAYCWGYSGSGQLGNGSYSYSMTPVAVSGGLTFASVSAGNSFTCGVTTLGAAYCWGTNYYGMVGDGTSMNSYSTPVAVAGGLTWAQVSAGNDHTCGVTTGGAAYCWGQNYFGAVGDGSTLNNRLVPSAVAGGLTWSMVSASSGYSCGVTTGGAAYCWGRVVYNQLGDGAATDRSTPVAVQGGLTFKSVTAAGGYFVCGLTTGNLFYCWGGNGAGRGYLGDGTAIDRPAPVLVGVP